MSAGVLAEPASASKVSKLVTVKSTSTVSSSASAGGRPWAVPQAARGPEATERRDEARQRPVGVALLEHIPQLVDATPRREVVEHRLEQAPPRAELVVHGRAGDAGAAGDLVDAELGGRAPGEERRAGGPEDPGPRRVDRRLAPAQPVGARGHGDNLTIRYV